MIDIHAHILPGIDDGAPDMDTALAMAEMAVESGVTAIVTTPHCNMPGRFDNYWDFSLHGKIRAFQQALKQARIQLAVISGMEVFGTPDTPNLLRAGKLTTLGGSKHLLIEFPFDGYGQQATEILRAILSMGYRPVVAHPERYHYTQENPALLNLWVKMGCLMQLNKGSLLGSFGLAPQKLAISMLERGFAAAVASDAHSSTVRTTWMLDIWNFICEEYSEPMARLLLEDNPRRILRDLALPMKSPEWF